MANKSAILQLTTEVNDTLRNKRNENLKKNCGAAQWVIPYLNNSTSNVYKLPNVWDLLLRHREDSTRTDTCKKTIESTLLRLDESMIHVKWVEQWLGHG